MAKTKISEFSATPGNNTDIDGINIAEGCAPSGINDAIRELMAQLKDFQTGAAGDSFNGPVGSTTAAAGAFTTLSASGAVTLSGGTANGVPYLNGSKVLATGSALTFDGTNFETTGNVTLANNKAFQIKNTGGTAQQVLTLGNDNNVYLGQVTSPTAASLFLYGNQQVFAAGGSEQMRLTSTGLGIGTSSPGHRLDVTGAAGSFAGIRVNASSFQNAGLIANRVNNGNTAALYFTESGANQAYIISYGSAYGSGLNSALQIVNGSNALTYDSAGNLGLGVAPSAWYQFTKAFQSNYAALASQNVSGSLALLNNAYEDGNDTYRYVTTNGAAAYRQTLGVHRWFTAPSGTAGNTISFTQAMTLDASGNLGVGATNILNKFQVRANTNINLGVTGGTIDVNAIMLNAYTDNGTQIGAEYKATQFIWQSGGTERARIDSSGNLLVGATSGSGRITASGGNIRQHVTASNGTSGFELFDASSGGNHIGSVTRQGNGIDVAAYDQISFRTGATSGISSGSERARIDSSGNLLVGTTTTNRGSSGFHVTNNGQFFSSTDSSTNLNLRRLVSNGDVATFTATSGSIVGAITIGATTTTYNTSSDYRLKENIQPMTGALAKVAALKPCTYKWKADGSDGEGFIAHELQAVVPQCVTGEKDAVDAEGKPVYQGIDTSFLVATLTAAIQELKAEFDAYKATHP